MQIYLSKIDQNKVKLEILFKNNPPAVYKIKKNQSYDLIIAGIISQAVQDPLIAGPAKDNFIAIKSINHLKKALIEAFSVADTLLVEIEDSSQTPPIVKNAVAPLTVRLQSIALRQALMDEIQRLKGGRENYILSQSSEDKILILQKLLRLVTIPEDQDKPVYFNNTESIVFSDLLKGVLNAPAVDSTVLGISSNWDLLNRPRNHLSRLNHESTNLAKTTSATLINTLQEKFGTLAIYFNKSPLPAKANRTPIRFSVIKGESLSEPRQFLESTLGTADLDGLNKRHAAQGGFTNGYLWTDHFHNHLSNRFIKKVLASQHSTAISDDDLHSKNTDNQFSNKLSQDHIFINNHKFSIQDKTIGRSYALSGLSDNDFAEETGSSISFFFKQLFVSSLSLQREFLFEDDLKTNRTAEEKRQTLIIIGSSLNDLVSVNKKPSWEAADKVIAESVLNLEACIRNGYRNFDLFNLPDLSLTPRISRLGQMEQDKAQKICEYFNAELAIQCQLMREKYPSSNINIFDVNTHFKKILGDYELFSADYELKQVEDFPKILKNNIIYYKKDDLLKQITYQIKDPCGQLREETLTTIPDSFSDKKIQKSLLKAAREKRHALVPTEDIRAIESSEDFDTPMTPLRETKAYKRLQKENESHDIQTLSGQNLYFYDDIHPSDDVHRLLFSTYLKDAFSSHYVFYPPEFTIRKENNHAQEGSDSGHTLEGETEKPANIEPYPETESEMVCAFVAKFFEKLSRDKHGFFGRLRSTAFNDYKNANIETILEHAKSGKRTREILRRSQWIDEKGFFTNKITNPAIRPELAGYSLDSYLSTDEILEALSRKNTIS